MQAALDLGEQGFEVLLVERTPSIGGVMVGLNKVFPTLDCSSCICTPRMAESAHHPRIRLQTYTEVQQVEPAGAGFRVDARVQAALPERGRRASAATSASGPARWRCRTSSTTASGRGGPSTSRTATRSRRRRCSTSSTASSAASARRSARPTASTSRQEPRTVTRRRSARSSSPPGLELLPMARKPEYGGGRMPNVMNPLAMERIQSSNGPYGRVLRPADGKIPKSIAYIQCAGSRDRSIGVPVLLARLLHVRAEAGAAAPPLHPRRRGDALLHGHPRLRQGLRAVLPPGGERGRVGGEGQGGAHHRRPTTSTCCCASSCSTRAGAWTNTATTSSCSARA